MCLVLLWFMIFIFICLLDIDGWEWIYSLLLLGKSLLICFFSWWWVILLLMRVTVICSNFKLLMLRYLYWLINKILQSWREIKESLACLKRSVFFIFLMLLCLLFTWFAFCYIIPIMHSSLRTYKTFLRANVGLTFLVCQFKTSWASLNYLRFLSNYTWVDWTNGFAKICGTGMIFISNGGNYWSFYEDEDENM